MIPPSMLCHGRPNYVYFDLETQKSAAEVGGWHNKRAMKMALGVTYSSAARHI